MLSQVKNIFKHSSVYSFGNMLGKVVSFIMLPVYTRCLSPSDYGIIEMLTLTASVISMLLSLRLTSALPRLYYGYADEASRKSLVSTMLLVAVAVAAVAAAGLFQGRFLVSEIVFKTPDRGVLFGYVFASMVFEICGQIAFTYLRVLERSMLFVGFSLLQLVLGLSLNILFLVFLKMGIMGVLYSMVLSNGIVFLMLQGYVFSRVGFRINPVQLLEILKFSLPLVPAAVASFVLNMGDRFLLSRYVDTAEIGIYSLGYKFGMLLGVFVGGPFLQAWEPKRIQLYEQDPNARPVFQTVFVYLCVLLIFGSLGISVLIREIVALVATPAFQEAALITPYVAFGYIFYTLFFVVDIGIVIRKKTFWYPLINSAAAAVNVGLNLLLIPRYGAMGAAYATAASFLVLPVLGYSVSQRYYPMRYDFARVGKAAALGAACYAASRFVHTGHFAGDIAVKALLLASFPAGLYFVGFFEKAEVDYAMGLAKSGVIKVRALIGIGA